MAKAMKGTFVVIPSQFTEDEAVQGYAFKKNSDANSFVEKIQKIARREYAKLMGYTTESKGENGKVRTVIDKEKMKGIPQGVPFDVLIQPIDADGDPAGEPMEFDQHRD